MRNLKKFCFLTLSIGLLGNSLDAEEHKIQVLVTVPRTVSTAFEKSIMARGDHKVFHEPWTNAYFHRRGAYEDAPPPQEIIDAGDYEGLKKLIYQYAKEKPVFIKDMIWSTPEILNDRDFLSDPHVVLTILIREPAHAIESFFLRMSESVSKETAVEYTTIVDHFDHLVELAEKYREFQGKWPIIVEAEELVTRPNETMQAFCAQAGIAYMPEALSWTPSFPHEWNKTARWHIDAAESSAFFVPPRSASVAHFTSVPEAYAPALEAIYLQQKPFYEKLKAMKLQQFFTEESSK